MDELTPLVINLHEDLGKLPAGFPIQLPTDITLSLIRRRLATPVADITIDADLIVDENQIAHVGTDLWSIQAA